MNVDGANIFVTGGCGRIGSTTNHQILRDHASARVVNSARTRAAALTLLRALSSDSYAGGDHHLGQLETIAAGLGGEISQPSLDWKYAPPQLLFSPQVARNVIRSWRAARRIARRCFDWCCYRVGV